MKAVVIQSKGSFNPEPGEGHFRGTVLREQLSEVPPSPELRGSFVQFKDGAFTKLHQHTGGQLLYVTEGDGFVEFGDGTCYDLTPGTRVVIPPGEFHRHGAKPRADLEHLAVTAGETYWWDADSKEH